MKLRSHLLLLVLGAVLPVLVFSAVMTATSWRQQRIAFEQRFLERVRAIAIALDHELYGHIRALQTLTYSAHLAAGDMRAFYEQAKTVQGVQPGWATVILADTTAAQVFNLRRPFGTPLPKTAFGERNIARVVATRQPIVSPLVEGNVLRAPTTNIEVPVIRDGAVTHVLIAAIDPPTWLRLLASYPVAPDATMTLLGQDGIVIARTLNHEQWVAKRPAPALYENSRRTPEGTYCSIGLEGQWLYSAHARSALSGWTVATGSNGAVTYESIESRGRRG